MPKAKKPAQRVRRYPIDNSQAAAFEHGTVFLCRAELHDYFEFDYADKLTAVVSETKPRSMAKAYEIKSKTNHLGGQDLCVRNGSRDRWRLTAALLPACETLCPEVDKVYYGWIEIG